MPKRETADERDRWVMVSISREQLREITKRRDKYNNGFEGGDPTSSILRITTDQVATRLLGWAIENAPGPVP